MTVLRLILKLECGCRVSADDADDMDRAYCPSCGVTCLVVDTDVFRDEDVDA